MRELWNRRPTRAEMRRLLLEIERARRVLDEIEQMRAAINRAWKADVGGQLTGLERLRCLLQEERVRIGILWDSQQVEK